MPTEPTASKFQTFELFKDGAGYTPIPHFFRQMQRKYRLPPAFWNTLFFVFEETIGRTRAGVSGYLAQSQIPGDAHEVGKWIAALDAFGGLLTVEYADYRSQKGLQVHSQPSREARRLGTFLLHAHRRAPGRILPAQGARRRRRGSEQRREIGRASCRERV